MVGDYPAGVTDSDSHFNPSNRSEYDRFAEFEIDTYSDNVLRLVIEGDPLPIRVLRWLLLQSMRERGAWEEKLLDNAARATDSYALLVSCTLDRDVDGKAENIRDVEIGARLDHENREWETVKVPKPSEFLIAWIVERASK